MPVNRSAFLLLFFHSCVFVQLKYGRFDLDCLYPFSFGPFERGAPLSFFVSIISYGNFRKERADVTEQND